MSSYSVDTASGASYGFSLNSSGYYESTNKGVNNSASVCVVTLNITSLCDVVFSCINYAESNYDFGILSNLDTTLTTTNKADSTNVKKSFKGSSKSSVQTVTYSSVSAGTHTIYVKYRKDSSVNSNNDSFQFKISFISLVPPVSLHVNIGGSWKSTDSVYVNIGGSWKSVDSIHSNIGGSWKSQ